MTVRSYDRNSQTAPIRVWVRPSSGGNLLHNGRVNSIMHERPNSGTDIFDGGIRVQAPGKQKRVLREGKCTEKRSIGGRRCMLPGVGMAKSEFRVSILSDNTIALFNF